MLHLGSFSLAGAAYENQEADFLRNSHQILFDMPQGDGVELPLRLVLTCNFYDSNSLVAGCVLSVYFVRNLPMLLVVYVFESFVFLFGH